MYVRKLGEHEFQDSYDTLCQQLYPSDREEVPKPPFNAAWCVIEPGKISHVHNHHEGETFFIVKGEGEVSIADEKQTVEKGDVIFFPPFLNHDIRNISSTQNLEFVTAWWEDMALVAKGIEEKGNNRTVAGNTVLVSPPPPTPNGDLHLGHLSGPYIGADVYTRYLKLRGTNAYYTCGAHDNEGYVLTTANRLGMTGRQLADQSSDAIRSTLKKASIHVDYYWRPDESPEYRDFVNQFFLKLYQDGHIVRKSTPSYYCQGCEQQLFQAFIQGECPQCGSGSQANSCETCGRSNHPEDLLNPVCKTCGEVPVQRPLEKFYFPLKPHKAKLEEYYKTVKMDPRLRAICERTLLNGLSERPITQVTDWGMAVPVEGFEDQRFDPWFELVAGQCLYAIQQLGQSLDNQSGWESFWKSDDADVVQFFGFDNGYFYALFFPAVMAAYDPEINLPKVFVNNEFYSLEGDKFSTSRGHAIWGSDFFDEFSADVVRFFLSYTRPETQQTNFSRAAFETMVQDELQGKWNGWLTDLVSRLAIEYDGIVPEPGAWMDNHQTFYRELTQIVAEVESAYEAESFSPQKASRSLCELVRLSRRFGDSENYFSGLETKKDERRTAIALELAAAKALAILSAPIMPNFASQLWQVLGDGSALAGNWFQSGEFVAAGRVITQLPTVSAVPMNSEDSNDATEAKLTTSGK